MVRWHHRLNGHGFGWTLGVGDGQGGLACYSQWGHKESLIHLTRAAAHRAEATGHFLAFVEDKHDWSTYKPERDRK